MEIAVLLGKLRPEWHPNDDKTPTNLMQYRSKMAHQPLSLKTLPHALLDKLVHRTAEVAAHLFSPTMFLNHLTAQGR